MKQRIIICGYPKSGNTWLTRLTAEIIGCPVIGFWCQPFNKEEAIEGEARDSIYQCFKAHHSFLQLQQTLNIYGNSTEKIIYIYRDPRDVVVSASNYFPVQQPPSRLRNILFQLPFGLRIYRKLFFNENLHNSYKLDIFVKGLVEGTTFGSWLQTPWKSHVKDFISQKDILCISYESLKQDPLTQASRICNYLSLTRSSAELQAAIDTQSFQRKKKKFLEEGQESKANFLHQGKMGRWRHILDAKQIEFIEKHIGLFMQELGYSLSNVE